MSAKLKSPTTVLQDRIKVIESTKYSILAEKKASILLGVHTEESIAKVIATLDKNIEEFKEAINILVGV